MNNQLYCSDETRKALVRQEGALNGIDFLEVLDNEAPAGSPPQQTLLVHCFQAVTGLTKNNVRLEGGVRVRSINVRWAFPADAVPDDQLDAGERTALQAYLAALPNPDRVLVVRTDSRGDFSTYTLYLVPSASESLTGFDPRLSAVDFSFKVDCPSDFDCKTELVCPEPVWPSPQISYLAKDYASFRRLILDRLTVTMPDWQERNPADLGMALVELLAYAGDYFSYYQDAVATEAYLGTARRRASVRRHARLIDYFMHDGVNARAWVCLEVAANSSVDSATLPAGTSLLSQDGLVVFESLHDVKLKAARNGIPFYTWRDPHCCLPKGATRATLHGSAADLELQEGDVLILEEILGPESGRPEEADPTHRHVVRLNGPPAARTDPTNGEIVLEVSWHAEDALPFPLCLRQFEQGPVSLARGNVVLADHGQTIEYEELQPAQVPQTGRYRPTLQRSGLTQVMPYNDEQARAKPAATAMELDLRQVKPWITLNGEFQTWTPQRDLLNSSRFAPEFVVEMESDGRTYLRFGDDVLGRRPAAGKEFTATYRVGNGPTGNVGADVLTRVELNPAAIRARDPDATLVNLDLSGIQARNPLPASGGTAPEPIKQVRLYAPQAFRTQERAVTEADYATAAQRHLEVQRAAATRRWTGSWYTMFITVDRRGGRPVDAVFESELRQFLERFRMAGYDLEVDAPHFISLDIALTVCVAPGYYRGDVKQALLERFSTLDLPDDRRGFFHPDNFTFGQPVYLSQIVAAAMEVTGVAWVQPVRFQRWGEDPHSELDDGRITFGRLEIVRLDNDPNAPENGKIEFLMEGGL